MNLIEEIEKVEKVENIFACFNVKLRTRPLVPALSLEDIVIEEDKKINITETKDAIVNTSFSLDNYSIPQYSFKQNSDSNSFHSSSGSGKCSPDIQPQPSPQSLTINFNDSCLEEEVPAVCEVPSNRPKSGKRPKSAKKKKAQSDY